MKKNDPSRVARIVATPNLPEIFKVILNTQELFVEGEEIIDMAFVEREGCKIVGTNIEKYVNWQPATLVVVTNHGLTVLAEGGVQIAESYYGYTIRHIVFSKISSITLDICMLDGKLSVTTTTGNSPEALISFNTAHYFRDFERIVGVMRRQMFKC
jgi:hypothetical protein